VVADENNELQGGTRKLDLIPFLYLLAWPEGGGKNGDPLPREPRGSRRKTLKRLSSKDNQTAGIHFRGRIFEKKKASRTTCGWDFLEGRGGGEKRKAQSEGSRKRRILKNSNAFHKKKNAIKRCCFSEGGDEDPRSSC